MGPFRQLLRPRALRILLAAGLLTAAISTFRLWDEHRQLTGAEPVPADILAARVATTTTGTGTNRQRQYRPEIRFQYIVDGTQHESDLVTPLGDWGSRGWANALVERFPPGSTTTAWVPTDAPDRAWLVRERSWKPPAGLAAGLAVAALAAVALWRRRRHERTDTGPQPACHEVAGQGPP